VRLRETATQQKDGCRAEFLTIGADFAPSAMALCAQITTRADIVAGRGCRLYRGALSQTVPTDAGGNLTDRDRPEWERTQNPSDAPTLSPYG